MSTYKIAVVVGSLRKESMNRQVAVALTKLLPKEFQAEFVEIGNLPLYNQDFDSATPEPVLKFKQAIAASQGVIFVTPEYNRSIPGVLKNALDQGSRPYGQSAWQGKPAGVLGTSPGAIGSALAQQHLRNVLTFLAMPTLTQPEVFLQFREEMIDAQGNIINEGTKKFLQSWVDAYVAWVKKINA
ncbi:NADPH-dependent FMN reductase [Saezia sanguinis]|uniref:NADPH-dependent FMN reductase n=1 Tax=Saezia sanguinis TaxID=1965230 RepID=UPI00304EABFB